MLCAIWEHLNNLKNVKNTQGGVLLLVKPATLLKVTLLRVFFFTFFKFFKWSQIAYLAVILLPLTPSSLLEIF